MALPCRVNDPDRKAGHPWRVALAKRFGPVIVDQACAAALELGVDEYHFVRRYLERQPALPLTLQ